MQCSRWFRVGSSLFLFPPALREFQPLRIPLQGFWEQQETISWGLVLSRPFPQAALSSWPAQLAVGTFPSCSGSQRGSCIVTVPGAPPWLPFGRCCPMSASSWTGLPGPSYCLGAGHHIWSLWRLQAPSLRTPRPG